MLIALPPFYGLVQSENWPLSVSWFAKNKDEKTTKCATKCVFSWRTTRPYPHPKGGAAGFLFLSSTTERTSDLLPNSLEQERCKRENYLKNAVKDAIIIQNDIWDLFSLQWCRLSVGKCLECHGFLLTQHCGLKTVHFSETHFSQIGCQSEADLMADWSPERSIIWPSSWQLLKDPL